SVLGINKLVREENSSVDFEQYLSMQEKTLIRMDSLISDIIDLSKNKRLDLELREIDFSEMVTHAIDDHSFMLNAPAIEKKINIEQFEKFVSDPRRISIVLNNLISNAIKYADLTKKSPELSVNIKV